MSNEAGFYIEEQNTLVGTSVGIVEVLVNGGLGFNANFPQTVVMTDGSETRPLGSSVVIWVGTTTPTNMHANDIWIS